VSQRPPTDAPACRLDADLPGVAEHLALDEALLAEAHEGRLEGPVVRTWMAARPTVVLGSSSRLSEEVDLDACGVLGVDLLRRPSGGLTVVLGPGCVMWSVVAPVPEPPPAIERIHAAMLDPLAAALSAVGATVLRRGSSDLAIEADGGERKVSGNALRLRRGAVLYHGTLLDDFDLDLVPRVLRHPPREPGYRAGRPHADFLANLRLGRPVIDAAVTAAFAVTGVRTEWPRDRVAELVRDRYRDASWTRRTG
jgi:lipoate-protein ligase A